MPPSYDTLTQLTRLADSICSYLCFVGGFAFSFTLAHLIGNTYKVKSEVSVIDFSSTLLSASTVSQTIFSQQFAAKADTFEFSVSAGIMVSLVGIICFIGFALMAVYLGNGLILLPYRLIIQWFERPKRVRQRVNSFLLPN